MPLTRLAAVAFQEAGAFQTAARVARPRCPVAAAAAQSCQLGPKQRCLAVRLGAPLAKGGAAVRVALPGTRWGDPLGAAAGAAAAAAPLGVASAAGGKAPVGAGAASRHPVLAAGAAVAAACAGAPAAVEAACQREEGPPAVAGQTMPGPGVVALAAACRFQGAVLAQQHRPQAATCLEVPALVVAMTIPGRAGRWAQGFVAWRLVDQHHPFPSSTPHPPQLQEWGTDRT